MKRRWGYLTLDSEDFPGLLGLYEQLPREGWTQERRDEFLRTFVLVLDFCVPLLAEEAGRCDARSEGTDAGESGGPLGSGGHPFAVSAHCTTATQEGK